MTSFNQLTSCQSRKQPRNNKSSNIDHLHKKMRTPIIPEPPVIIPNIKDQQQNRRHQKQKCGSERIISQPSRNKVHIILSKIPTPKPAQLHISKNRLKSENKNQTKKRFSGCHQNSKTTRQPEIAVMKKTFLAERQNSTLRQRAQAMPEGRETALGCVRGLAPHRGYAAIKKIRPTAACSRTHSRYPYARHSDKGGLEAACNL